MSELKVRFIDDTYLEYFKTGKHDLAQIYLKSEVDKVIAELKDDVTYWKKVAKKNMDDNVVMAKQRADAFKRERHQKYKRCLAMAMWCSLEQERIELIENQDITDDDFDKLVKGFYKKWHKRWLGLAEKFKPNNNNKEIK